MTFSIRQFCRQVPARTLQSFVADADIDTDGFDWNAEEPEIAKNLTYAILAAPNDISASVIADAQRIHVMSDERGRNALLNAAPEREQIAGVFSNLENDHERAAWVFVNDATLFEAGEELRYFDYYAEGNYGRSFGAAKDAVVSRERADLDAFGEALRLYFRKRDGSGASCHSEIVDRHAEGSTQVTVYLEALPSNSTEFINGAIERRASRPAIEAAVVYHPDTGVIVTVAKGGKEVHETFRRLFAKTLLHIKPEFDPIQTRNYQLQGLIRPRSFPTDPAHGIERVRVRRLKLVPSGGKLGACVIEAPAGKANMSVYDLSRAWFDGSGPLERSFAVVQATLSLHFRIPEGRRRAKVVNLQLSLPNSSNLKNLSDADRAMAEVYLERWELLEPIA